MELPQRPIIDGDAISASIAAASIVAKVTRDRICDEMDERYPAYGFRRNKGYGTPLPPRTRSTTPAPASGIVARSRRSATLVLGRQLSFDLAIPIGMDELDEEALMAEMADAADAEIGLDGRARTRWPFRADRWAIRGTTSAGVARTPSLRGSRHPGWHVLARRWRVPEGELDLVALDPAGTLVAVEVRARRTARAGAAAETVEPRPPAPSAGRAGPLRARQAPRPARVCASTW